MIGNNFFTDSCEANTDGISVLRNISDAVAVVLVVIFGGIVDAASAGPADVHVVEGRIASNKEGNSCCCCCFWNSDDDDGVMHRAYAY